MPEPDRGRDQHETDVDKKIGRKAERKLKARRERDRSVWFGLGMFGLIGWSVAVPTLLGIALGLWIDSKLGDGIAWTLGLLFVGVVLGCLNAWYWVKRENDQE